jgi:hypothetical protein
MTKMPELYVDRIYIKKDGDEALAQLSMDLRGVCDLSLTRYLNDAFRLQKKLTFALMDTSGPFPVVVPGGSFNFAAREMRRDMDWAPVCSPFDTRLETTTKVFR